MIKKIPLWLILAFISAVPRLLCVFVCIEVDGDAYSYIEIITNIKNSIAEGKFDLSYIYTVWLPFYQIICALIGLIVGDTYYIPRFISTFMGSATCVLVFYVTTELTKNKIASVMAFLFVVFNPFHISYSASSTTDIAHIFFVILGLYLFLKNRIISSAVSIACAVFTRYESWAFLLVLPVLTYLKNKKKTIFVLVIVLLPMLLWFAIGQITQNDAFASFKIRDKYIKSFHEFYTERYKLTFEHISWNLKTFFFASNIPVSLSSLIIIIILLITKNREINKCIMSNFLISLTFYCTITGFILFSYFTRNQPELWLRHGLSPLVLGTPLFAFSFFYSIKMANSNTVKKLLLILCIILIATGLSSQITVGIYGYKTTMNSQIVISNYLKSKFRDEKSIVIYCDEPSIRVLSKIPRKQFIDYSKLPESVTKGYNKEEFLKFLRERSVKYIVYIHCEYSVLPKIIPELKTGEQTNNFEPILYEELREINTRVSPNLWLYKMSDYTDFNEK